MPSPENIPYGFCHCDCGQKTTVPTETNRYKGWTKGVPLLFLNGHCNRITPVFEAVQPFKIDGELCNFIPLSKGLITIVDATLYPFLMRWKWCAKQSATGKPFYAIRNPDRRIGETKVVRMHRVVAGIEDDSIFVDHRFHNTLDNRASQLRTCTVRENSTNMLKHNDNSTGYKGVTFDKRRGKYAAQISSAGVYYFLGYFDSPLKAALAYDAAAIRLHGEFAHLNFPNRTEHVA
jgi:hypothetical protein